MTIRRAAPDDKGFIWAVRTRGIATIWGDHYGQTEIEKWSAARNTDIQVVSSWLVYWCTRRWMKKPSNASFRGFATLAAQLCAMPEPRTDNMKHEERRENTRR